MPWKPRSIEPDGLADVGRGHALRAQLPQAGGQRRFRQLAAIGIEDQAVMVVARRRQAEQRLQQTVDPVE